MRAIAPLAYLWTLPNTLLGLLPLPVLFFQPTARIRLHTGVVEISGGVVKSILDRGIFRVRPAAMTLGHVVWAIDDFHMNATRAHERVHVRQYERWGPLFLPVYLLCSLVLQLRGKDHYRDNPFEREAYGKAP